MVDTELRLSGHRDPDPAEKRGGKQAGKQMGDPATVKLVYFLYLASFIFGITAVIGLIVAYINKKDAPDWIAAHYQYQIRTFWIFLAANLIGGMTAAFLIGLFILVANFIWMVVRCAAGLREIGRGEAKSDPEGLWI